MMKVEIASLGESQDLALGPRHLPGQAMRRAALDLFGHKPLAKQRDLFAQVLFQAEKKSANESTMLQKAAKRRNMSLINRLIVNAGNHGSISLVHDISRRMRQWGIVEQVSTFDALIDAYSRLGRVEDAQAVLREADDRSRPPTNAAMAPLVKAVLEPRFHLGGSSAVGGGSFASGGSASTGGTAADRIEEAAQLIEARLGSGAEPPNHHTINTLLRGCKRFAPEQAPAVWQRFERFLGSPPPATSLALMAEMACMKLDASKAARLVSEVSIDARLMIEIAAAHALCGDLCAASTTLDAARARLDAGDTDGGDGGGDGGIDGGIDGGGVSARQLPRRGMPSRQLRARHAQLSKFVADGGHTVPGAVPTGGAARSAQVSWPGGNAASAAASATHLEELIRSRERLCVEVGAGAGDWLVLQAASDPSVAWVAIEPQLDRVHQLWCQLRLHGLTNVHVCAADADTVLGWVLPSASIDAVHLRFPHAPKMELQQLLVPSAPPTFALGGARFLDNVLRVLRPSGVLHVVTNEAAYCAWLLAFIAQHSRSPRFRSMHDREGGFIKAPMLLEDSGQSFSESTFDPRGSQDCYRLAYKTVTEEQAAKAKWHAYRRREKLKRAKF